MTLLLPSTRLCPVLAGHRTQLGSHPQVRQDPGPCGNPSPTLGRSWCYQPARPGPGAQPGHRCRVSGRRERQPGRLWLLPGEARVPTGLGQISDCVILGNLCSELGLLTCKNVLQKIPTSQGRREGLMRLETRPLAGSAPT